MIKTTQLWQGFLQLFLLFGYLSSVIVVRGQTNNIFRGYSGTKKDNDGIITDVPLTTKLSNGLSMPLVGLGVRKIGGLNRMPKKKVFNSSTDSFY
jgi:hypothetical protein